MQLSFNLPNDFREDAGNCLQMDFVFSREDASDSSALLMLRALVISAFWLQQNSYQILYTDKYYVLVAQAKPSIDYCCIWKAKV